MRMKLRVNERRPVTLLVLWGLILLGRFGLAPSLAAAQQPSTVHQAAGAVGQPTLLRGGDTSYVKYGNPYTDYLRQPYGVLPRQFEDLPPVKDDPNEPFDWYRTPRAGLGVFGGGQQTMISPEGWLRNDFGTLKFYTGDGFTPIDHRVKTWKDGWLPVAEFGQTASDGARYHFEYFSATVPDMAQVPVRRTYGVSRRQKTVRARVANMVTFARVTVTNTTSKTDSFTFGVGLSSTPTTAPAYSGTPLPTGIGFDPKRQALVGQDSTGRDRPLFTASADPTSVAGGAKHVLRYAKTLAPGESWNLVVKLPYWLAQESDLAALRRADYDRFLQKTVSFWRRKLARASTIEIPEAKVEDAYRASIVQMLTGALNIVGDHWLPVANPTVYHNFYLRDAVFHIDALLDAGLTDVARRILWDYPAWQDARSGRYDGEQLAQYDGNGQALWAIGEYYRRTRDQAFARHIWPSVKAAMAWQWQYREGGLYPANTMTDDEAVRGRIVGWNLWAIAGEFAAADIARGLGKSGLAATWTERARQFAQTLEAKVTPQFRKLGVVPPTTEGIKASGISPNGTDRGWYGVPYGIDWGNLHLVWPGGIFDAQVPMVTSSLKVWEEKMFEGLFTYPVEGWESKLHAYSGTSLLATYLRRGDQWPAIRYLYNMLVHTSAMHMTSEGMNATGRWGWSRPTATMPHNQFSSEYVAVVRDMLAFEGSDGSLHLANAYSPAWTKPGQQIAFSGLTSFGSVSYRLRMHRDGMTMRLRPPTRKAPKCIVVNVPENVRVRRVRGGGSHARVRGNQVVLRGVRDSLTLRVLWSNRQAVPPYSYRRAVADYQRNYQKMTSPPVVSVRDVRPESRTVFAGDPVRVAATILNTGGAGRLPTPDITLYVDGKPAATDTTTLARGIGFTTPKSIISFDRNREGVVPVKLAAQICAAGRHEISIGVDGQPPTSGASVEVRRRGASAPAPASTLTVTPALRHVDAGGQASVSATLTNTGCRTITDAEVSLTVPEGWKATPTIPARLDSLVAGASAQVGWQVAPGDVSPSEPVTEATLQASATYGWAGHTTGRASGEITVGVLQPGQAPYHTVALGAEARFGQAGDHLVIFTGKRKRTRAKGPTEEYYNKYGAIYRPGAAGLRTVAVTKVSGQGDVWPHAKAGLIMRNDMMKRSAGYVVMTLSDDCHFMWDSNGDGKLDREKAGDNAGSYPRWMKLKREGKTFTGYCSSDGKTWFRAGSATLASAAANQDVGLAASPAEVFDPEPGTISRVDFKGLTIEHH